MSDPAATIDLVALTVDLPFVGRADQVDRFRAALGRAREGEPSVLLVSGDAGVGKTRALTRMAEIARAEGAWVVVSHCVDLGEVGLPYLPFTETLQQLRGRCDEVDQAIAARPALGRLLDVGLAEPAAGGADQTARGQLFDGIASAGQAAFGGGHHFVGLLGREFFHLELAVESFAQDGLVLQVVDLLLQVVQRQARGGAGGDEFLQAFKFAGQLLFGGGGEGGLRAQRGGAHQEGAH